MLFSKIIGALVTQNQTTHCTAFVNSQFGFDATVTVGYLQAIKANSLCLHANSKAGVSKHSNHFHFPPAVGTRPLAEQIAWLRKIVVQYNPYLQNVIVMY